MFLFILLSLLDGGGGGWYYGKLESDGTSLEKFKFKGPALIYLNYFYKFGAINIMDGLHKLIILDTS